MKSNEDLNELYQVENEQPPSVIEDDDLDELSIIPSPSYIENEEVDEDESKEDEEENCEENSEENYDKD